MVLLLHGFAQPTSAWSDQLSALAAAGFRAVAPAQRGYCPGARPGEVAAYRIERLVDDVDALAAALGHSRFHLVGFDTGGAVAWHLAATRPDALLSLTVLSTAHPRALVRALARSDQALRSAYIPLFWLPRLPEHLLAARDHSVLRRFLGATGLPADRAASYAARLSSREELEAALAFFRAMRPWALGAVATVAVPTVYAWGSHNRVVGRAAAQATARYAGAAFRFVVYEGEGHWLVESRPRAVSEAILAAVAGDTSVTGGASVAGAARQRQGGVMARIERSIEIDRPPEEVFEFLTDLDRLPDWATSVVETMDAPGRPLQAGQRFRQKIRVVGLPLEIDCEVTAVDAPRSVEYRAGAPVKGWAVMKQRVLPSDGRSRVEIELDYALPGGFLGEAIGRVYAERRNAREAEHSLANLKDLLEGRPPGTPP